jgi:hypothetical protein
MPIHPAAGLWVGYDYSPLYLIMLSMKQLKLDRGHVGQDEVKVLPRYGGRIMRIAEGSNI